MSNVQQRANKRQRGSAVVEFALCAVIVSLFVFSIVEILMAVYTYSVVADSAKEAVRYAIVNHGGSSTGGTSSCSAAADNVTTQACTYLNQSLHDVSNASVTVSYPDTAGKVIGNRVDVAIVYNFVPYVNLTWAAPTLHGAASGRIIH